MTQRSLVVAVLGAMCACGGETAARKPDTPPDAAVAAPPPSPEPATAVTPSPAGGISLRPEIANVAYIAHGVCPFACCRYGGWTMNGAGTLRAAPAFTADSVGRLAEHANVIADSGVVVMHTIGLAVIVADPVPLQAANPLIGDTLEILNPVREDVKRVRWHGLEFDMQIEERGRLLSGLQMIREPVLSWWVYMTDTAGHQAGWLRMGGMSTRPNASSSCGG